MPRFEKWEGLGNDFVIVEEAIAPDQARALCDRRHGIGGDGVLVVERLGADRVRMVVLNADGSRPEMCGNGLRCVAAYLADAADRREGTVIVETDAGERVCELEREARGRYLVSASMGAARVGDSFRYPEQGLGSVFVKVDVGNPHAVTFDPYHDDEVEAVGRAIERAVDGGCNVEFAAVGNEGSRIDVVVWERGVGRTLACGTGACAVAAAAAETGRAPFGRPIDVWLPGGPLAITVEPGTFAITMRGPARRAFSGEVEL